MVGPSHVVRLKQLVSLGELPGAFNPNDLVGQGGVPVWSKQLLEAAKSRHGASDVFLIVGDFRFGNGIFEKGSLPDQLFVDGYMGINGQFVTEENDKLLLQRCLDALKEWQLIFSGKLKLIFWDLFCRQVQDRLAGKYIQDKVYRHPTFNLGEVQEKIPQLNLIDLSGLLNLPMHQVMRLFIDSSNHPSQAGYFMLRDIIANGHSPLQSYLDSVKLVEDLLIQSARKLRARRKHNVVIAGKSVWFDTLMRYVGPDGVEKINAEGVSLVSFGVLTGHPKRENSVSEDCEVVYISSGKERFEDLKNLIENRLQTTLTVPGKVVPWEVRCSPVIAARKEIPKYIYSASLANDEGVRALTNAEVELGPVGYPTMRGIIELLDEI